MQKQYETESMRKIRWCMLPYGMWTTRDGRRVLYNRHYRPFLQIRPDGTLMPANPDERVPWESQHNFYHDNTESKVAAAIEAYEEFTGRTWNWQKATIRFRTLDKRLCRHSMSPDWVHVYEQPVNGKITPARLSSGCAMQMS
jgi:hypothetical protein